MREQLTSYSFASPIGRITVTSNSAEITELLLPNRVDQGANDPVSTPTEPLLCEAIQQIRAYFDGELREFDLPLALQGTEHQKRVWDELRRIPFGALISYGELARRIGRPTASRAVGAANGKNPIAIIIPCHRVIGANGSLTGYGGGLDVKRWLIQHEAQAMPAAEDAEAGTLFLCR